MHRIVCLLALVALLAGCGGTDWRTVAASPASGTRASGPQKPAKSPKSVRAARAAAAAATAETAAERPYIDALVAGAQSQPGDPGDPPISVTLVRCIATALVHGFGSAAFASAGVTPSGLRDPNSTLNALGAPSDAQVAAMGIALQRCHVGSLTALDLAENLHISDAPTVTCLSQHLDADTGARRFIVLAALQRSPDLLAAHGIVGVLAACIDLPSYVLGESGLQLDATTRACILDTLKSSEAQLKDIIALQIAGQAPTAEQFQEALAVSINQCRPGAHTGFTVPTD